MTPKTRINVYGRKHIHKHIRALAAWQAKKNPLHTLSEEYDRLLVAGIKAIYQQTVVLDPQPAATPAPQVEGPRHG